MMLLRRLPRWIFLLPFLAVLAACTTVGPDYRVPDEAVVKQEKAGAEFVSAKEPIYVPDDLPRDWWHMYEQTTLNELINKALAANTNLRIATANLARSRAILEEARTMTDPIFDLGATPTYGINATKYGAAREHNHWFYSMGAGMSYQLDLFGKLARAIEAATADMEATRAAYDLMRITVIADTTRAYLDVCSSGHQIDVARHSVDLQEKFVNTTERLASGGRATALEVSRTRAQLEQLRAAVPPLVAQQRTAVYQLAVLTGELPDTLTDKVGQCRAIPALTRPIPVGDGAALLKRRPDIREAERALAAATARIGVATAELYPDISLGLTLGSTGTFSDWGSSNFFRWGVGPLISWTLPATGPARARIKQAEAATAAALAYFDGTVLRALKETESALTTYARALDRNAALKEARDQSALASRQAHMLYEYGRTDFLTTLDADRTLADFESRLAESEAQLARNQVELFLALGGGWDPAATEEKPETETAPAITEAEPVAETAAETETTPEEPAAPAP
ncbi:MAG: TolC family protein [Burkholderiaceae bacterium]|jgi:NodT family efflux transporter outer membrane factor (OMF) lipoprotein|nr:TolC family protein [Burkholderiaceae bacterium]